MKERHEKTLGSERHARVAPPSSKAVDPREPVQMSAPVAVDGNSPEWRKYAACRLRHFASSR
jgi:hypothetical protein